MGRVGHEQRHSLGQPRVETPRRLAKRIRRTRSALYGLGGGDHAARPLGKVCRREYETWFPHVRRRRCLDRRVDGIGRVHPEPRTILIIGFELVDDADGLPREPIDEVLAVGSVLEIRIAIRREVGLRMTRLVSAGVDVETLRALEDALVDFAGCAVVISHDRFFLDRICTHILAFEGEAHVEWFEGNFEDYEEDKKGRLGADALEPKRIKHKKFAR